VSTLKRWSGLGARGFFWCRNPKRPVYSPAADCEVVGAGKGYIRVINSAVVASS
jgi:hypothetical protein